MTIKTFSLFGTPSAQKHISKMIELNKLLTQRNRCVLRRYLASIYGFLISTYFYSIKPVSVCPTKKTKGRPDRDIREQDEDLLLLSRQCTVVRSV